jgi:hypothetical protein
MKYLPILLIAILALVSCNNGKQNIHDNVGVGKTLTDESITNDMVDFDEIARCEEIIEDSALMNGTGEKAWKKVGDGMIRIKNGNRYYLRLTTDKGKITSVTYKYDD